MKTQSLLCSFVLMCIGGMALQAQEYEYVPIVRENVRWTFSDQKEKMTLLLDNRYIAVSYTHLTLPTICSV